MFVPKHTAALAALYTFLPRAGRHYAAERNYDYGPDRRHNVSMLSPWVRVRVLPEWTVLREVLQQHSAGAAGKFIDEICWRSYWKGWLQQHPSVWKDYQHELAAKRASHKDNDDYLAAVNGTTGIDCLDAWTRELVATGYLHNHARMWYASIWIHTLQLPWVLGAAFFHKHLYDGDAASNTLSWRWVAGLHTTGKYYLARPDNIEKYTDGRFKLSSVLATKPFDLNTEYVKPPLRALTEHFPLPTKGRIGLIIHEEDLSAAEWIGPHTALSATAGLLPVAGYKAQDIADTVIDFRLSCMRSMLPAEAPLCTDLESILQWATESQLETVVMAEPPVGVWNEVLPGLQSALAERDIRLWMTRHWWDAHFYPQAQAGFFKLKKAIPKAIQQL
jgi:deoxyribodipyrimidine photo-lyase